MKKHRKVKYQLVLLEDVYTIRINERGLMCSDKLVSSNVLRLSNGFELQSCKDDATIWTDTRLTMRTVQLLSSDDDRMKEFMNRTDSGFEHLGTTAKGSVSVKPEHNKEVME